MSVAGCSKEKPPGPGTNKSASITVNLSDSGTNAITAGECVSFSVVGENTAFSDGDVALEINYNDGEESIVIPEANVQVLTSNLLLVGTDGSPDIEPCWCFGPGAHPACGPIPSGPVDITVRDGNDLVPIDDAFALGDLQAITVTEGSVISGMLDREGDNVYYTVSVDDTFIAVTTVPQGATPWLPTTTGYSTDYDTVFSIGSRAAMRDLSTLGASFPFNPAVASYRLQGGTGFDFELRVREFQTFTDYSSANVGDVDRWDDGGGVNTNPNILPLSNGLYRGAVGRTLAGGPANDDTNPNPLSDPTDESTWGTGCTSQADALNDPTAPRFFPIVGQGRDVVYRYAAGSSGPVLVAVQSEGEGPALSGDFVIYVVEDDPLNAADGPLADLVPGQNGTCHAGTDFWGDRATDTVIFQATAGVDYFVFVDLFNNVGGDRFWLLFDDTI